MGLCILLAFCHAHAACRFHSCQIDAQVGECFHPSGHQRIFKPQSASRVGAGVLSAVLLGKGYDWKLREGHRNRATRDLQATTIRRYLPLPDLIWRSLSDVPHHDSHSYRLKAERKQDASSIPTTRFGFAGKNRTSAWFTPALEF